MALTDEQKARLKAHGKANPQVAKVNEMVEGRPLHVDGDYLAYYCAGNDDCSPALARSNVLDRLELFRKNTGSDRIIVHLSAASCDKGLRYHIAGSGHPLSKEYQAQRGGAGKPKNWEFLREYLETYEGDVFKPVLWYDREADDAMAYVSEASISQRGVMAAVATADKDMRMFAGLHVVWKSGMTVEIPLGTFDVVFCDKQYGHKFFWMQMVMGDQADHIPGLPRCGEVAANKLLAGVSNNQDAAKLVLDLYRQKAGEHYADFFVEQAALLWMRNDKGAHPNSFLSMPLNPFSENPVIWDVDVLRAAQRMLLRLPVREVSGA